MKGFKQRWRAYGVPRISRFVIIVALVTIKQTKNAGRSDAR